MTDIALAAALTRMIDATNAEDRDSFLTAFADAVVDDMGRTFTDHAAIATWSNRENIGAHDRIHVTAVIPSDSYTEVTVEVTGRGYNGPGTFTAHTTGDLISRLTIRA